MICRIAPVSHAIDDGELDLRSDYFSLVSFFNCRSRSPPFCLVGAPSCLNPSFFTF